MLHVLAYRVITLCGEIHYYHAEETQQQQEEELEKREEEEEEEQSSTDSYSKQSKFHESPMWHPYITYYVCASIYNTFLLHQRTHS